MAFFFFFFGQMNLSFTFRFMLVNVTRKKMLQNATIMRQSAIDSVHTGNTKNEGETYVCQGLMEGAAETYRLLYEVNL